MSVERIAAHLRGETVSPSEAAGVHESAPDHGGRISRPFDPYQGWGPNTSSGAIDYIARAQDPGLYDFKQMMNNFNAERGSRRGNPWMEL